MKHAGITGIERASDGRDTISHRVQMDGPENPGVRISGREKRARHEPERNEEDVHDGVKTLGRFHRPGDEKPETGEAKADDEKRTETDQDSLRRDVNPDKGREQEKDQPLQKGEGGAAEDLAANDAPGRDRRDQDRLEKTFPTIFDDRDGGKDGGEKHDQDERARIKIFALPIEAHDLALPESGGG